MMFPSTALWLLSLAGSALATYLPPKGAITIGGTKGTYANISTALLDKSSSVYFVYAGTYTEQVYIQRANVTIIGQSLDPLTYLLNQVTITNNIPASQAGSNDASGTVRVAATDVSLYNLNIENTYGHPVVQSQAIALSVQATRFAGYGLKLTGWQDTLYTNTGAQFYAYSLIQGAVDFIFGRHGSVWITKSVIYALGEGYLTASGRQNDLDDYFFVIDQSIVTGNSSTYLGRPWGNYARVIFQKNYLGSNINSAGWSIWNVGDPRTNETLLAEYRNIGPGAVGPRANFSVQLTEPFTIQQVLNTTSWVDKKYL